MHLTLHLTNRCSLRCTYCYASPGHADMAMDTVRQAIAWAIQSRSGDASNENVGVVFFGGEPLLRRDLVRETVRHCQSIERTSSVRFHFKMTTNGLHLDDEFFEAPDTGRVFVALSHDGTKEAHDAHRVDATGCGSFDRLVPIVRRTLAHRPNTPSLMVVTPRTVHSYAESVQSLYAAGFRYILATLDHGAAWNEHHVAALRAQYTRLSTWYYEAMRREEKFFFSPFEVKIASHVRPTGVHQERCDLGRRQVSVAPDGRLYPCVQFVDQESWCIGNVLGGIDAEARRRIDRTRAKEDETCASCAVRLRCNHRCGCVNVRATGTLSNVPASVCAHERIVLEAADEVAARLFRVRDPMFLQKHYNDFYPLVSAVEDATDPSADGPTDLP